MRYFFETIEDEAIIGRQVAKWQKERKINIIEKGDPIDAIRTDVIKIQRSLKTLEKAGINEEVMVAYIRTKGVSKSMIYEVLNHQKDFFKKLKLN